MNKFSENLEREKKIGDAFFRQGKYEEAVSNYNLSLELIDEARNKKNKTSLSKRVVNVEAAIYSSLSVCYLRLEDNEKAILYGDKCISTAPKWIKGYLRKMDVYASIMNFRAVHQLLSLILLKNGVGDFIINKSSKNRLLETIKSSNYFHSEDFKTHFPTIFPSPDGFDPQFLVVDPQGYGDVKDVPFAIALLDDIEECVNFCLILINTSTPYLFENLAVVSQKSKFDNLRIVGISKSVTLLKYCVADGSGSLFQIASEKRKRVSFENVSLRFLKKKPSVVLKVGKCCMIFSMNSEVCLENCSVSSHGIPVFLSICSGIYYTNCQISNVFSAFGGTGSVVYIKNTTIQNVAGNAIQGVSKQKGEDDDIGTVCHIKDSKITGSKFCSVYIQSNRKLVIDNCEFHGNRTSYNSDHGSRSIQCIGGEVIIKNSKCYDEGGSYYFQKCRVKIKNCRFKGRGMRNDLDDDGIYLYHVDCVADVQDSTFEDFFLPFRICNPNTQQPSYFSNNTFRRNHKDIGFELGAVMPKMENQHNLSTIDLQKFRRNHSEMQDHVISGAPLAKERMKKGRKMPLMWKKTKFEVPSCNHCGKKEWDEDKFKVCGGCRTVYYCSVSCQRKDWVVHKSFCKEMKKKKNNLKKK